MKIGMRIKELRNLCNLTQEELANRTELTKGYISQLENDLTEPSISTLEDIVNALGTNMSEFFKDSHEQVVFNENNYFVKLYDQYEIKWLVPNAQKNEMEPIMVTINPNSATDIDYPHEGQEFGYVLEGELTLVIDDKAYTVKKGETFYYTSIKHHYLKNQTNEACRVIWISSPPNF